MVHNGAMADAIPSRPAPPPLDDSCALFLDVDGTLVDFDTDPDVSAATGFELPVGGAFEFSEDSNLAPTLYAVADQANTDVRIVGHTDSTGSDAINNPLSMDRAASTRSYLTARGVDGRRIVIEGMGERYPIATNDTAEGRARNRRVEIFVGERPRG